MPNGLLRLRFERSGGPLHLTISGSVSFIDDRAEVTADPSDCRRELAGEELRVFQGLNLDALRSSPFSSESSRIVPGQPDRYQYDVIIETHSGQRIALRFSEQPQQSLNSAAQGLGDLAEWVRKEIGAIWRKRAAQKP